MVAIGLDSQWTGGEGGGVEGDPGGGEGGGVGGEGRRMGERAGTWPTL